MTDKIFYPNDILSADNEKYSMTIVVKELEILSEDGTGLVDIIKKEFTEVQKIITDAKNDDSTTGIDRIKRAYNHVKHITAKENAKTIFGFALPIPEQLSDSQSHKWETTESAVAKIGKNITDVSLGGVSVNNIMGELAQQLNVKKPIINPGYFQDYNGTDPREFSFSWNLIPNNVEEAKAIFELINRLKKYTLPKSTLNGLSLLSPYFFEIQFGNKVLGGAINMAAVVCKSMSVSYSDQGGMQLLPDGTPKSIRLDLSFVERQLMTSDLY